MSEMRRMPTVVVERVEMDLLDIDLLYMVVVVRLYSLRTEGEREVNSFLNEVNTSGHRSTIVTHAS